MRRDRCQAKTATGKRCRNPAVDGEDMCARHLRGTMAAFTPALAEQIASMLRAGNHVVAATRAAGVSRMTFATWMRRGEEGEEPYKAFREQVEAARGVAEVRHVTQIANAAGNDWRAASWMIERQLAAEREEANTAEVVDTARAAAAAEATATLEAIGEPPEMSAGAIDRYATAVGAWKALEAQWEAAGRPGVALGGATGVAQVPHPLVAQIAVARRDAAILGGTLGLDPHGRRKLLRQASVGRPQGAASAADRAAPPRRTLKVVG